MTIEGGDTYHLLLDGGGTVTGTPQAPTVVGDDSFVGMYGGAGLFATDGLAVRILDRTDLTLVLAQPQKAMTPPSASHILNAGGVGSFTTGLDDPSLSTLEFGRLFQITLEDVVRFTGIVESQDRAVATAGEEAAEVATIQGRHHSAILESAVVEPEGGAALSQFSSTRVFNWANPGYDASSWVNAAALARQGQNPNATSQWATPYQASLMPTNWHDPSAYWMGPAVGDWEDTPDGRWYLRWSITIATAATYRLEFSCDNDAIVYLDGVQVGDGGYGYFDTYKIDVTLPVGTHVIAARVYNQPKTGNNPSAFIGALWSLDDGELDTVIARTQSGSSMVVLNTPVDTAGVSGPLFSIPVPGMTVGEVLDILLDEAQARGALTGWTWDFTTTADTDSTAWPNTAEIALQVGSDYLSVLKLLSGTYIDWTCDVDDLVLHAYVPGGLGSASGVTFTKGTTITDLVAVGEG